MKTYCRLFIWHLLQAWIACFLLQPSILFAGATKTKGKIGSFKLQECNCQPWAKSRPQFFLVVHFESDLNEQKQDVTGWRVEAWRWGCQNVAKSFYLDVCPHGKRRRREHANMESGLQRHVPFLLYKALQLSATSLSLHLPSRCAHLTGPDLL